MKQLNLQIAHLQLWSVSCHWHRRSHEDLHCFVTMLLISKAVQSQVCCYFVQYPIGAFLSMCDTESTVIRTLHCNNRNCGSNTSGKYIFLLTTILHKRTVKVMNSLNDAEDPTKPFGMSVMFPPSWLRSKRRCWKDYGL